MKSIREFLEPLYKDEKNNSEWKFNAVEKTGYGYDLNDPIYIPNINYIYQFIKTKLGIEGKVLKKEYGFKDLNRLESHHSKKFAGPVDKFEVLFVVVRNGYIINELYELYFCAYPKVNEPKLSITDVVNFDLNSVKMPEGFVLKHL